VIGALQLWQVNDQLALCKLPFTSLYHILNPFLAGYTRNRIITNYVLKLTPQCRAIQ